MQVDLTSQHLARLLQATILRLPLDIQRDIQTLVELVHDDPTGQPDDILGHACTGRSGQIVYLNRSMLRQWGDEPVCNLIAHELAHAVLWTPAVDKFSAADQEANEMVELDADELAFSWGFGPARPSSDTDFATPAARERARELHRRYLGGSES